MTKPFSNVAPKYVEMMQQLIQQHKATKGIIISDHMYEQVMDITDDLFLLRDGCTFPIKQGRPDPSWVYFAVGGDDAIS